MKSQKFYNASDLHGLIAARYSAPTYAYFREVKAAVGFSNRTADGVAVAMWRSHGLSIHGFEIKTYRGDWLRELKHPEKADDVSGYCDYWWIVAGEEGVVKKEELPEKWGLLLPRGSGLSTVVQAPRLSPRPLDRDFVCEILRHVYTRKVDRFRNEDYEKGFSEGRERAEERHKSKDECVSEFEKYSGLKIEYHWPFAVKDVGKTVKAVLAGRHAEAKRDLESILSRVEVIASSIREALNSDGTIP